MMVEYYLIIALFAVASMWVQHKLKSTFKKYGKVQLSNQMSGKEIAEKISKGKISKFLNDNSLLNQLWIMDPKKKVSDILKENSSDKEIKVLDFVKKHRPDFWPGSLQSSSTG